LRYIDLTEQRTTQGRGVNHQHIGPPPPVIIIGIEHLTCRFLQRLEFLSFSNYQEKKTLT